MLKTLPLLFALCLSGCSAVSSTDLLNHLVSDTGYDVITQSYSEHPRQQMDIYLPTTRPTGYPIVFVHGGAWREGDKGDYKFVGQALTERGHPVIIPNYRLFPDVTYPAFIDDIAQAIHRLESSQPAETLMAGGYVLMGHSAGAHTVALLATENGFFTQYGVASPLKGIIALSGPYDLPLDNPEVGVVFAGVTDKRANPVVRIDAPLPPTLLLHGLDDQRVKPLHTRHFAAVLEAHGTPLTVKLYEGVNHVDIMAAIAAPLRFLAPGFDDISTFLESLGDAAVSAKAAKPATDPAR